MKKTTLSKIIDFIIVRGLVFAISFLLLSYYIEGLAEAALLSVVVTIVFHIIASIIKRAVNGKRALTAQEQKKKNNVLHSLMLNTERENIDFFMRLLEKNNAKAIDKDFVITTLKGECDCVFVFKLSGLEKCDAVNLYKTQKTKSHKNLIVFTNSVAEDALSFSKSLNEISISIFNGDSVFELMKLRDIFPEIKEKVKEEKLKFLDILDIAFNKKRFAPYLITGILLMGTSLLSPLKTYYMVFAAVCLGLALFCKINKRYNRPANKLEIFEKREEKSDIC